MTTATKPKRLRGIRVATESSGWLTCQRAVKTKSKDPFDLLQKSAVPLPGNVRFGLDGRQVVQLGEVRDTAGLLTADDAAALLADSFRGIGGQEAVPADELACLLGEGGIDWEQSDGDADIWEATISNGKGQRCRLQLRATAGGAEVTSQLLHTDESWAEICHKAMAQFLCRAHMQLRFVRFELQPGEVRAASFAVASRLECELPDSIAAVTSAALAVANELRALTHVAVAKAYLQAAV